MRCSERFRSCDAHEGPSFVVIAAAGCAGKLILAGRIQSGEAIGEEVGPIDRKTVRVATAEIDEATEDIIRIGSCGGDRSRAFIAHARLAHGECHRGVRAGKDVFHQPAVGCVGSIHSRVGMGGRSRGDVVVGTELRPGNQHAQGQQKAGAEDSGGTRRSGEGNG